MDSNLLAGLALSRIPIVNGVIPLLIYIALAVVVTWPQAASLGSHITSHFDPLFSIWRLAWVAHALRTDASRLFDGNIFYPARNTLTYSDAMMLEGAVATPLFWLGMSPIVIYNLLLLGSIAVSGLAMFVLARHLLKEWSPALVAGAIFTLAPYRIEHVMHLELQWAMWVPLTLWAIHRTVEAQSWRYGLLAGLCLWLQILSSVYYGAFLAITAIVFVAAMLVAYPRLVVRALPALAAGCVLAVVLTLPYALQYFQTARVMGPRDLAEMRTYSATLTSYLSSPGQSARWGWTEGLGSNELRLFPGAVAIALAMVAIGFRPRRIVFVYVALLAITIELSMGLNGYLYSWLVGAVDAMRGFRSPARLGIMAQCAVAMLAGFGAHIVCAHARKIHRQYGALVAAAGLVGLVAFENDTKGIPLMDLTVDPPGTAKMYSGIRAFGPGVVLELPLPTLDRLPGHEATYMYRSLMHWQPMVNGYSGYYPKEYVENIVGLRGFPDDASIAHLSRIPVRYIVVHEALYEPEEYRALLARIAGREELRSLGVYPASKGETRLYLFTPNRF